MYRVRYCLWWLRQQRALASRKGQPLYAVIHTAAALCCWAETVGKCDMESDKRHPLSSAGNGTLWGRSSPSVVVHKWHGSAGDARGSEVACGGIADLSPVMLRTCGATNHSFRRN